MSPCGVAFACRPSALWALRQAIAKPAVAHSGPISMASLAYRLSALMLMRRAMGESVVAGDVRQPAQRASAWPQPLAPGSRLRSLGELAPSFVLGFECSDFRTLRDSMFENSDSGARPPMLCD